MATRTRTTLGQAFLRLTPAHAAKGREFLNLQARERQLDKELEEALEEGNEEYQLQLEDALAGVHAQIEALRA